MMRVEECRLLVKEAGMSAIADAYAGRGHLVEIIGLPDVVREPVARRLDDQANADAAVDRPDHRFGGRRLGDLVPDDVDAAGLRGVDRLRPRAEVLRGNDIHVLIDAED